MTDYPIPVPLIDTLAYIEEPKRRNKNILLKLNRKEVPQLQRWLAQQCELVSLQPRNSLEDFFLQVTSAKQHVETFSN